MKIAISSDSPDLEGQVPLLFADTRYLLIVESDNSELLQVIPRTDDQELRDLARAVLKGNCEGLLCGPLDKDVFLIIADEGQVTRYNATGLTAAQALDLFNRRSLELIRDHIGGDHVQRHRQNSPQCGENH